MTLLQTDKAKRYRRRAAVLWRRVGPGVVLLPPSMSSPLSLGPTGAELWTALAEPIDVATAARLSGSDPTARGRRAEVVRLLGILTMHDAVEELT